ncbi:spore gernimation protein [Psychrobacillus vulpis]|uniref:Spore gernimation protein n=1 Tax=Psychrobacillus vulpis TaxID=2325572 RepID=A0A544TR31_9BACI|nr:spore gernimation protein [Psychrobacillus vulpis]
MIEGFIVRGTGVGPISILHVIFLSMTVIGLKNHVTIIPPILQVVGRDGWAAILLAAIFMFPWLFLLLYVHHKSHQLPLKDWLKQRIGKVGYTIILYIIGFYLIVLSAFTIRETLQWVKTTFLPNTPMVLLLTIFTILCILLISTNIQTIAMVNVLVLFGVIVLGFFVAFVNIQVKDYELLRPFFEHGFKPIVTGAVYPASGFVELLLLLFLQHHYKGRIRWYHFAIMLFILMGLTMGPLIGAITEFGPIEAAKQSYPAYEEWGLATIGRFIEHMDFFSVYQWLTGAFIRVGFLLFIVVDLFNLNENRKRIWTMIAPPFFFLSLSLSLLNDDLFLEIKGNYFLICTFVFLIVLSLFLTIVAFASRKTVKNV